MVVLASCNQCEQWAAANEWVTNAKYSCVYGLLCVLLGSLRIDCWLRAGFLVE